MDDIAIIGIGCRVPGADNIDEFWRVLVNSENHIVDVPKDRWNNDAFYSDNRDEAGKTYVKKAGFINGHDEWDNKFFGVSDNEAVNVDPQQRLVLECTHMALEDAGITRKYIQGTSTGVFIGAMNEDYKGLTVFEHQDDTNYSATGTSSTIISARVSYVYDLRGPCMVVDTACSSSMIAIHLGSQAIKAGDCEVAICGGVNCMLSPGQFMTLCKAKMLSPTGQCQSFCDNADGYGRGEGCGIVIVKSYEKAVRDRNKIWGIIKTGSNQDGHAAQPITAPSGDQQKELMKKLYTSYGIDPTRLQYIEAHGTGTSVGDPIEVNALGSFIESYRSKHQSDEQDPHSDIYIADKSLYKDNKFDLQKDSVTTKKDKLETKKAILIGSVKSNIGHLESAAGVAALIKVLLMMEHGKYVPSLHVKKDKSNINRKLALDTYGLDISLKVADWRPYSEGDRICCVNCFGFGGSNTHAIVIQKGHCFKPLERLSYNVTDNQYKMICISNTTASSLKRKLELLNEDVSEGEYDLALHDISFTSIFHRDHFTYRTLLFGRNPEEIKKQAKYKAEHIGEIETGKKIRIIFVFCGVGTTWKGMCREMMDTQNIFRETVNSIDELLKPLVGWSIAEKFKDDTDYGDPFVNHIAIFCTQVALFELWKSLGIFPQAIVGQSVGEVAAAFASGSLHLKDAVNIIVHRSEILAKVTGGKMMVVGNIAVDALDSLCRKYNHRVAIAVYSSPVACTVSGDADAVDQLKADLEELNKNANAGIMITPLSVQCAYHSHHMEECSGEIESKLKTIEKGKRMIDHFSTVTGKLAEHNTFLTGQYWAKNIRKPVLFMDAILQSTDENATNVFVELGPRQVLRAHLKNIMGKDLKGISLPSMNSRKECEILYASLGKLFELDADIYWKVVGPTEGHIVPIPRHIFQKTKILYIPKRKQFILKGIQKRSDSHMFLRQSSDSTADFKVHLDKESAPFVYDHFMYRNVLVPGATYIEAAFEIGHQKTSMNVLEMSVSIEFIHTLMPKNDKQCQVDVKVVTTAPNEVQYHVEQNAKRLCQGKIVPRTEFGRRPFNVQRIKGRCKSHRTKEENYECLDKLHFQYGESLRVIEQSWSSEFECVVELKIPESVLGQRKVTHMHPSVIDGLFQIAGILGTTDTKGPALPKGVASFLINRPPQRNMFGYSQLVKSNPTGNHYNYFLLCPDGHVLAEVYDFYIKTVKDGPANVQNLRHCLKWRELKISEGFGQTQQKSAKSITPAVFGCERFFSHFKPLTEKALYCFDIEKNGDIIKQASRMIEKFDSVIFAPPYHIQKMSSEGSVLFECIKKSFIHLSHLFGMLRDTSTNVPVFVVTENVFGLRKTTNICGAELWGLARSAMNEGAAKDVKLIDMTFSEENAEALKTILDNHTKDYNEYLIENGNIHYCEVIESDENVIPLRRKINLEMTENIVLKTSSPSAILRPFFDMKPSHEPMKTIISEQCQIHLKKICLHDPSIFLTSLGREDEQCNTDNETGYPVMCIEGVGSKRRSCKGNMEREELGFCFPAKVSAVVSIPVKCTFNLATLPVYTPGMFTVGVILWNIIDACKPSDKVTCIVDNDSSLWLQLLKKIFYFRTTTISLAFESYSRLSKPVPDRDYDVSTVIILTQLSCDHLDTILKRFPAIQSIITIERFITKKQKMLMKMQNENLTLQMLKMEDMFSPLILTNVIPNIFSIFSSLGNKLNQLQAEEKHNESTEFDIFSLPFAVLAFENENENECIPLMVSRENVFRTNGCYIVVGGLTGLGWELVQYMASHGAKYIATFSRRRPNKDKENEIQQIIRTYSCQIIPVQVDITDVKHLKNGIDKLHNTLHGDASIRGIFHGGGVTCDKFLKDMSEEDIEKVLLPKVLGTWNLHVVTQDIPLDFFIMHSSVVSVFGNQGQCNYAAGNSFQDSFAHYRQSIGLCGQSINWSALSLGMAKENEQLEKYLSSQGFNYLTKEEIRECFIESLMTGQSQTLYGKFDWQKMQHNPIVMLNPNKFADILKKHSTFAKRSDIVANNNDMNEFYGKEPLEQKQMVFELVKSKIVETFVVDEHKLTENTEILALGIDSMAAMSFTNVIFDVTDVRIPIGTLFDESATVGKVAYFILEGMQKKSNSPHSEIQQSDERIKEYLAGDISFMQKTLLDDFVKDPLSPNIIRQVDFEITGLEIQKSDMKIVFNHLIRINTDLRRIYRIEKEGEYQQFFLDSDKVDICIEDVDFNSICEANSEDERYKVNMNITKDLPIKVMIAFRKDKTRVRMYVHAVLGDLSGITNLFIEMADIFRCHFQQKELPTKDTNINSAEAVRRAIIPQSKELMKYWKTCFQRNIEPFTLSADINDELEEKYWEDSELQLPTEIVEKMMGFISKVGISLYHFIISTYMILLHEKTGNSLIPLVTFVDMRSHVQELQSVLQSCSNAIPVIGDLRDMGSLSTYLKRSSHQLNEILQHSAYPFKLIQEEMMSEDLKKHIGRHRFIMENLTSLNNDLKQEGVEIRIGNYYYKRHVYETTLHVEYDTQQNRVNLQFGYNGKAVAKSDAEQILHQMLHLIATFVQNPQKEVKTLLKEDSHVVERSDRNRNVSITQKSSFDSISPREEDILNFDREVKIPEQSIQSFRNNNSPCIDNQPLTDCQGIKQEIIYTGKFTKQTTKGWEHSIKLKIVKSIHEESIREVLLTWGKGRKCRVIYGNDIAQVEIKKTTGMVYVLVKTNARDFIFKSPTLKQAQDWLAMLKQVDKEIKHFNRDEFLCHL